jgi:mannose-6-phosphate isomerase-like protein (cupin superfamily)
MSVAHFFDISQLQNQRAASGKRYLEFLRVAAMSAGVYVLPAGGIDPQSPHKEDELYYVVRGRARMTVADNERTVQEGSVIFVAANVEHRFHDIEEELTVLVFFAPAES